jgi:hypothetical protein
MALLMTQRGEAATEVVLSRVVLENVLRKAFRSWRERKTSQVLDRVFKIRS